MNDTRRWARDFDGETIKASWMIGSVHASVIVISLHTQPNVPDVTTGNVLHGVWVLDVRSTLLLVLVRDCWFLAEVSIIHCAG